jgi:hypothetical protein
MGYSRFLLSRKKHLVYAVGLMIFVLLFQSCTNIFTNYMSSFESITTKQIRSDLSLSIIYQERLRALTDRCTHSRLAFDHNRNHTLFDFIRQDNPFNNFAFVLRSQSLVYCAVPKVATKTLLTIMFYAHLHEISNYLLNHSTQIDFTNVSTKRLVNMTALIEALQKVGRRNILIIFKGTLCNF